MSRPKEHRLKARLRVALLALVAGGPALCGCRLVNAVTDAPGKLASSIAPSKPAPALASAELAPRLMRYADLFALEIQKATVAFAEAAGSVEARIRALRWRIDYTSEAWKRATVDHPYAGLFDTLVLVTALRAAHEERWSAEWGEPNRILITALQRLEGAAWKLAEEGMTPAQVRDSHTVIDAWLAGDPAERLVDVVQLPGFDKLASGGGAAALVSGLTDLVRFDPLGGLEPATREVRQARALAERFFYYVQRVPELLEARVELLSLRTAETSETRTLLEGWERTSRSAEALAPPAAALPALFAAARTAALAQVSTELTRQREGLVGDLERARAPLGELLGETRTTAEATRALADSLSVTLAALGTFLDRFEPRADAAAEPEADARARPFDVTEYGAAAERIGAAVHELNTTLAALDRSLPELQRVLDATAARGERTIDHAYRRGLTLLAFALAGTVAAVLLVRWTSQRARRAPPEGGISRPGA